MKRILLVFAFVLIGINAFCNEKKNHVIISFDLKSDITMANNRRDYTIKQVKEVLPQILKTNGINSGYVSLQTFSASENAENLDDYIIELKAPFTEFSNISIVLDNLQSSDFSGIMPEYGFSLLTVARPYSLLKFKEQKDEILVDRTFLVLITDNKFNGNDNYKKELDDASPDGIKYNAAVKKNIMANMISVQQNYFYELIDEKSICYYNNYSVSKGSMTLFEVIPLQQYFSVESVLDFPHTITATRTKDGYKAIFKVNQLDNPNYRFISSEAFLPVDGYNEKRHVKLNQNEIFDIPESLVEQVGEDNISIDFRTWVQLIDNVYNHTILSPDGDKLQGAEGLNRSIKIKLEEDAKILGFIPLTDGLYDISFWTNDQSVAAATWGVIFILILLAVMIFSIWQSTRYKSKRNDVKL